MSYAERLKESGADGAAADRLLRAFAQVHGLNIEESNASLKVRGPDRRSVVQQPSPGKGVAAAGLRVQFHYVDSEQAEVLRTGIKAAGGRPEQVFSFVPMNTMVSHWDTLLETVLLPFFDPVSPAGAFEVGRRVRLRRSISRFPYATVGVGATGVIVESRRDYVSVHLDEIVRGLEEWNNELRWDERSDVTDVELSDDEARAQATRYFTTYWTTEPWSGAAGELVDHAASNEFRSRGVKPGDIIYIVHYRAREVYVGARLIVAELVTQEEAQAHFGYPVWDADDHVLALRGSEERLVPDRMIPRDILPLLEFVRPDGTHIGIKFDTDGAANQQTLRAVRELSSESARALDELIELA